MGIGLLLKKEGISNVRKLDTMNINKIASFISEKICQSFPELHLSQSELFIQISCLLRAWTIMLVQNMCMEKMQYILMKN